MSRRDTLVELFLRLVGIILLKQTITAYFVSGNLLIWTPKYDGVSRTITMNMPAHGSIGDINRFKRLRLTLIGVAVCGDGLVGLFLTC